jgi:protein arginine kinase activator
MICESCHQNLATVHLTEIVQKYKKETHLCEECAKSKGVPYKSQFSVKEFVGGVGKKDAEPPVVGLPGALPGASAPVAAQSATLEFAEPCPSCGITFAEFRSSGRLGCPTDYDHFKRGLVPLLEKIHGAVQHTGRIPARVGARIERQRLIGALQRDLSQAVEREEYERAAELRDKIRGLENQQVAPAEEPSK